MHTHPSQYWSLLYLSGLVGSLMAPASWHSSACITSLRPTWGGSLGILNYLSMSVLVHLGKSSYLWGPWGWMLSTTPMTYQMSHVFSHPPLVPLVLSKFLAECVKGQFGLIIVTPCWMEAPWLPTVLNMFADVPHWHLITKDLTADIMVS